jgi:hypothetical protein
MAEYLVKMDIWWGSGHCDTFEFHVNKISEIDKYAKRRIIEFARRYTFDCGDLGYPLNPSVGNVTVVKIEKTKYLNTDKLEKFMNNERNWTEKLIKEKKEIVDGHYNLEIAPLNQKSYK